MEKKGQASMEFLMTYGWAILAAVLAISVLAYYGVFSPGKSLPEICSLNPPLGCSDYEITASDNAITLDVRNGVGEAITIHNFTVTGCTPNTTLNTIAIGGKQLLRVDCGSLAVGDRFDGQVSIKYQISGKTFNKTATGDVRAKVVQ